MQLDAYAAVREGAGQPAYGFRGQGGLALSARPEEHRGTRAGAGGEGLQLRQLVFPPGEVGDGSQEIRRARRAPAFPAGVGEPLEALALLGVEPEGGGERVDRTALRTPAAAALQVTERADADPGRPGQVLQGEPGGPAQGAQHHAEGGAAVGRLGLRDFRRVTGHHDN